MARRVRRQSRGMRMLSGITCTAAQPNRFALFCNAVSQSCVALAEGPLVLQLHLWSEQGLLFPLLLQQKISGKAKC